MLLVVNVLTPLFNTVAHAENNTNVGSIEINTIAESVEINTNTESNDNGTNTVAIPAPDTMHHSNTFCKYNTKYLYTFINNSSTINTFSSR
jgi:hypothetical protein